MPIGVYQRTDYHKHINRLRSLGRVCPTERRHKLSVVMSGCGNPFFGKKHTTEAKIKISNFMKTRVGENNHGWKGGKPNCIDCNKELAKYSSKRCRACNIKYMSGENNHAWSGKFTTDKRLNKKIAKAQRRMLGGILTTSVLQMVYEDNIKKYGTLTCYLCNHSIEFGRDTLEHRLPLIRGGTNEYNNLGVACSKCNSKKGSKTEEEYRKETLR